MHPYSSIPSGLFPSCLIDFPLTATLFPALAKHQTLNSKHKASDPVQCASVSGHNRESDIRSVPVGALIVFSTPATLCVHPAPPAIQAFLLHSVPLKAEQRTTCQGPLPSRL